METHLRVRYSTACVQGRIREEGMQQSTSKQKPNGRRNDTGKVLEKYSNI